MITEVPGMVGKKVQNFMGQVMQKCVLCHVQTTKVQISLRIHAVWSAHFFFPA